MKRELLLTTLHIFGLNMFYLRCKILTSANTMLLAVLLYLSDLTATQSSAYAFDPILVKGYIKILDKSGHESKDEIEYHFLTAIHSDTLILQSHRPQTKEGDISIVNKKKRSLSLRYYSLNELPITETRKLDSLSVSDFENQLEDLYSTLHVNNFSVGCSLAVFHFYCFGNGPNLSEAQKLSEKAISNGEAKFNNEKCDMKFLGETLGLRAIELNSSQYQSKCTYQTHDNLRYGKFVCDIEDTVKDKRKKFRLHFERRKSTVAEVDRIGNHILSLIPKGKDMTPNVGDVIPKRWDGSKFVDYINPVVLKAAGEQKLVEPNGKSKWPWAWIVVGAVGLVAIVIGVIWRSRRKLAMVILAFVTCSQAANASDGPYCGLFCVQAASSALGRPINFHTIMSKDFLHADPGSTTDDLVRALATGGLIGTPRNGLTTYELRQSSLPIIMHTRSPGAQNYHHWIVFLGSTSAGQVSVFDPAGGHRELDVTELLSVWDGYGVVVSTTPLNARLPISPEWILITVFGGGTYVLLSRRWHRGLSFVVTVIVTMAVWHLGFPQGLLRSPRAVGTTTSAFYRSPIKEWDLEQFQRLKERGAVVIDARPADAFRHAHIPGAINLAVNASLTELYAAFDSLDRHVPIVCYCATSRCAWADVVANQLIHAGFRDVSVYRGGIAEWAERGFPVQDGE